MRAPRENWTAVSVALRSWCGTTRASRRPGGTAANCRPGPCRISRGGVMRTAKTRRANTQTTAINDASTGEKHDQRQKRSCDVKVERHIEVQAVAAARWTGESGQGNGQADHLSHGDIATQGDRQIQ